jgi:hypothetical protein
MKAISLQSAQIAWGVTTLVCIGCGAADQVKVYPVRGKVTFEGKPLAGGGSISFVPTTNQSGKTAGGDIKEDGTYQLTTYAPGDGSMVGDFRVVINQIVEKEPERTPDGAPPPTNPTKVVAEADRIPPIYSDFQQSPLTAKVEAKASNEIDFDLKRK